MNSMNIFHGYEVSHFGVQQFSKHNQVHVDNQSDKREWTVLILLLNPCKLCAILPSVSCI